MSELGNSMVISSIEDVDQQLARVSQAAKCLQDWIASHQGDGLDLLRSLKFNAVGFHPTEGHELNVIEQVNQTWTFVVALEATRKLLEHHPEAGGFTLAPGAHAAQALDIMSMEPGFIGAETFAAVDPRNNRKLQRDMKKLAARTELHRYIFFMSPLYPETRHQEALGRDGIQVWSVHV